MRHSPTALIAISLSMLLLAPALRADESAAMAMLKATLQSRFPDVKVDQVGSTPLPGLYEIVTGDRIVYADLDGNYLLMGPMLDTKSRRNLTEARLGEIQAIEFEALPFSQALKTVRGTGKRQLAVFADPDCPYCQQLEKSLEAIDNITIYTFLYPLESIHPGATSRARQIWCAEDGALAWANWMLRDEMVAKRECGNDPIVELQKLGQSLKINSTPTLFTSDGRRIPGAVSAEQLEALLDNPDPSARGK
jgi:thiol:disulfide interchange protein DsbC